MKKIVYIPLILLILLFTGCGISDAYKSKAARAQESLKIAKEELASKERTYERFKSSPEFKKFSTYAKNEQWFDKFNDAKEKIKLAEKKSIEIDKVIKDNDSDKKNYLIQLIASLKYTIGESKKLYSYTENRINFLRNVMKEAPEILDKAKKHTKKVNKYYTSLKSHFDSVKKDYPNKTADLNSRIVTVKKISDDTNSILTKLNSEYKKDPSKRDYALFGDFSIKITENLKKVKDIDKSLRKKTSELYQSYSKIISDMKIDRYVVIGRESWDSDSDFDRTDPYIYKERLVSEKLANYFNSQSGVIATYRIRWGANLRLKIAKPMWDALNIDEKEGWQSRWDDEAEYWVENVIWKYYHKYIIIENNNIRKTDWVKVNENTFYKHEDHLGMEIVSKPYGYYEEEKINSAFLPGMQYIAKPNIVNGKASGSNQYGEWKTDSSGNHFWSSFAGNMAGNLTYDLLFGGNRYYYDDYIGYNNWKRSNRKDSYYGSNNQYGTYGYKTYKNTMYTNSIYARRNPSIVRNTSYTNKEKPNVSKNSKTTVRGAGSSSRGRGPSGGGK